MPCSSSSISSSKCSSRQNNSGSSSTPNANSNPWKSQSSIKGAKCNSACFYLHNDMMQVSIKGSIKRILSTLQPDNSFRRKILKVMCYKGAMAMASNEIVKCRVKRRAKTTSTWKKRKACRSDQR